jgi:hypothetical protein
MRHIGPQLLPPPVLPQRGTQVFLLARSETAPEVDISASLDQVAGLQEPDLSVYVGARVQHPHIVAITGQLRATINTAQQVGHAIATPPPLPKPH